MRRFFQALLTVGIITVALPASAEAASVTLAVKSVTPISGGGRVTFDVGVDHGGCDPAKAWFIEVNVLRPSGQNAASSGPLYNDPGGSHTYVVNLDSGQTSETFTAQAAIYCPSATGGGQIHQQSNQVSFTVSQCDADLFSKAQREFQIATDYTNAGVRELDEAANSIRDFGKDYAKESFELGAEKASALQILHTLSETLTAAAEVTAVYVGIGVTAEELAFKFYPLFRDSRRLSRTAKADFDQAIAWAARGKADLDKALAQGPCLRPTENQLNRLLKDQRLQDQARQMIDSWENNGYLYVDPVNGEVLSEEAALARAKAALTSSGSRKTPDQAVAARRKLTATARQIRSAIAYLDQALGIHRTARRWLGRLQAVTDEQLRRLKSLLKPSHRARDELRRDARE